MMRWMIVESGTEGTGSSCAVSFVAFSRVFHHEALVSQRETEKLSDLPVGELVLMWDQSADSSINRTGRP